MALNLQRRTEDLDLKSQQLDEVSLKLADALASRDHLASINTRLEEMLEAQTKENAAFAGPPATQKKISLPISWMKRRVHMPKSRGN